MSLALALVILASPALAADPPELPVPVVVPPPPPLPEPETCTVRPMPGGRPDAEARTGRTALGVRAVWADHDLVIAWLPRDAGEVVVHVASAGKAAPDRELLCATADDGRLVIDGDGISALQGGADVAVAVLQATPDAGPTRLAWVPATGRPGARLPSLPARWSAIPDRKLRSYLRTAQGFEAAAGIGAAWAVPLGLTGLAFVDLSPGSVTLVVSAPSLPLEVGLAGTEVAMHRAYARLDALGRPTSRKGLHLAEGLQYGGLGLQLVGALVAGLAEQRTGTDGVEVATLGDVAQTLGAAVQLGAVAAYEADARELRKVAATLSPTADGARVGVRGTF